MQQYNISYIKHLPITVTISETVGDVYNENVIRPTYTDPYIAEINYFYDVIIKDLKPKTTPEDAIKDFEIFNMMVQAMKKP